MVVWVIAFECGPAIVRAAFCTGWTGWADTEPPRKEQIESECHHHQNDRDRGAGQRRFVRRFAITLTAPVRELTVGNEGSQHGLSSAHVSSLAKVKECISITSKITTRQSAIITREKSPTRMTSRLEIIHGGERTKINGRTRLMIAE